MRNIWKASLNSAAAATRERHNKVQNPKVEGPDIRGGRDQGSDPACLFLIPDPRSLMPENVIAPPGASPAHNAYICYPDQEAPHVFIPQEAGNTVSR
jgi:hypothetical protein